jgi:hypothetical protein
MSMQSLREQLKQAETELRATPGKTKEWSDKLKVVKDLREQLVKSGEAIKKHSV